MHLCFDLGSESNSDLGLNLSSGQQWILSDTENFQAMTILQRVLSTGMSTWSLLHNQSVESSLVFKIVRICCWRYCCLLACDHGGHLEGVAPCNLSAQFTHCLSSGPTRFSQRWYLQADKTASWIQLGKVLGFLRLLVEKAQFPTLFFFHLKQDLSLFDFLEISSRVDGIRLEILFSLNFLIVSSSIRPWQSQI